MIELLQHIDSLKLNIVRLGFLLCLVFTSLFASSQDTIKIQEVEVSADRNQKEAVSVQKIDSMSLMDPSNKDLSSTLQKYSHAFVKSYGIGSTATVSLRGSGSSHTNLMWNGTQLNSSSHGVADFSLYPPFFTEEVELYYGQNSSAMSSGGLGGSVSIANNVRFQKQDELFLQQQFGSFGYESSAIRVKAGGLKFQSVSRFIYKEAQNNFEYRDLTEEGFPMKEIDHAQMRQRGILQSLHYRPKSNQRLDLHFWYFESNRELPAVMALKDLNESQFDENMRLQAVFHQYIKNGKITFNSSWLKDRINYSNSLLTKPTSSLNNSWRNFISSEYRLNKWTINSRLDLDIDISEQQTFDQPKRSRGRQAAFLQLSRSLGDQFTISTAARQEWIAENQYFLPQTRIDYSTKDKTIISWLLLGKNMKYPSLNDLYWATGGNPNLEAEVSKSAEFGQEYNIRTTKLSSITLNATVFYSRIEDYIQWTPTNRGYWMANNLKTVESKGVESGIKYSKQGGVLDQEWSLIYNYVSSVNLQKNHPDDASVGKQLIYVPEHQYNLHNRWIYDNYFLDLNLQFIGARYLRSDNSDFLPYYTNTDVSVGKKVKMASHSLNLLLTARNLFDREYQAIQWRPMPGRNYMITLNYQIN